MLIFEEIKLICKCIDLFCIDISGLSVLIFDEELESLFDEGLFEYCLVCEFTKDKFFRKNLFTLLFSV